MTIKHGGFKVIIHPACILYFGCLTVFSSWRDLCCYLAALIIHEAGHLIMASVADEKIRSIHLTPYGGIIRFRNTSLKGIRGVLFAAGGPIANLLALVLMKSEVAEGLLITEVSRKFASANLLMLVFNCIPALPLDGGQILFSIGYFFCPVSWLITVMSVLGIALGIGMAGLAIFGAAIAGTLNCTLLIVGVYMIIEAYRERVRMLLENAYAVFQERKRETEKIREIRAYRVLPETKAIKLIHRMTGMYEAVFLTKYNEKEYILNEKEISDLILNNPDGCVAKAIGAKLNQ